jgi:hypothetical protein
MKKPNIILAWLVFIGGSLTAMETASAATTVTELRCEFMKTPLGIEGARPGLSWTIQVNIVRRF